MDGQALAVSNSAELSHFVVAPDVATSVTKVKETTGSNRGLLESAGDGTLLAGIPMIVSLHVANGEVWGLDKTQVFTVIRKGSTVELIDPLRSLRMPLLFVASHESASDSRTPLESSVCTTQPDPVDPRVARLPACALLLLLLAAGRGRRALGYSLPPGRAGGSPG